jgi:biopolymer transport protein ExbD
MRRKTALVIAVALLAASCGGESEKDPPPNSNPPTKSDELDALPQVRVVMSWDESTYSIHRRIGVVEHRDDGALQKAIAEAHKALVDQGEPEAFVTIDADGRVPWKEVTNVVDVIKRCGITKIEFAMGSPPKKPK